MSTSNRNGSIGNRPLRNVSTSKRPSTSPKPIAHRCRKLLHRRQIDGIDGRLRAKGLALVPLEMYFDEHNRAKLSLSVGRGRKLYDKRHNMTRRQSDRDIQRVPKERSR